MAQIKESATYLMFLVVWSHIARQGCGLDVRVSGGSSVYEGRVEVYHGGKWGSVCDDKWADANCRVVCQQIGFSGGTMTHDADAYGTCTGPIHLDDVICDGDEFELDECKHANFGDNNCDHKEDVGCICDPSPTQSAGSCDSARHRIRPFSAALPGVGRAEVYTQSEWRLICDDFWDDHAASVFCTCLNYTDAQHFRALWSSSLINMAPTLNLAYDAIKCSVSDTLTLKNVWECHTDAVSGKCNAATEAAGVACIAVPQAATPVAPSVELTCDGAVLSACFRSSAYNMSSEYLRVSPACNQSTAVTINDGVCYNIDMEKCPADIGTDASFKTYCYDVAYTQFDSDPLTLLTDTVWNRRACCSVGKNGSVNSGFSPDLLPVLPAATISTPTNFSLDCFTDESFSGPAMGFPAHVTRGQEIYCRVSVDYWDDQLYLVVPSCSFHGKPSGPPTFVFLDEKCPTTDQLGLSYFSFGGHSWGYKFVVPKFQGYDELYVSCDTYVCDTDLDDKPYCDRSCSAPKRRRRSTNNSGGMKSNGNLQVSNGPLLITDSGFGPLLTVEPTVRILQVPYQGSETPPNSPRSRPSDVAHRADSLFYNTWVKWIEKGTDDDNDIPNGGASSVAAGWIPVALLAVVLSICLR